MRAIRTRDFLYIRNFKPERYPAGWEGRAGSGRPVTAGPNAHIKLAFWPFKDIDVPSPTKQYMMDHRGEPEVRPLFKLAFEKRPAEELYDLRKDPNQLINVADNPSLAKVKAELSSKLMTELRATADPRVLGAGDKFDEY